MVRNYLEKMKGRYCKIVTNEPGADRASVVTGILDDVDYIDGFIIVDSIKGLGCISIDTIIAIKPKNKNKKYIEKNFYAKDCK